MDRNATGIAEFLASRSERDVVRLTLSDGSVIEGSYLTQAGMHFLHVRDVSMTGSVHGPFSPDEVAAAVLVKPREQVIEEIRERRVGEAVPGSLVRTRDGYEARLERLANVLAREPVFRRRLEIEAQFNLVADEISLAKTKRNWMIAAAGWRTHSNKEPDRLEMAGGDLTVAERLVRPRPQDFHPDPAERRKRAVLPPHVAADPLSPPNMLKALRAAGFKARVSVLSEMDYDRVDLLVDFPGGKMVGRFAARGRRGGDGMSWTVSWEGGDTMTGLKRRSRALRSEFYATLRSVLKTGLAARPKAERPAEEDDNAPPSLPPR